MADFSKDIDFEACYKKHFPKGIEERSSSSSSEGESDIDENIRPESLLSSFDEDNVIHKYPEPDRTKTAKVKKKAKPKTEDLKISELKKAYSNRFSCLEEDESFVVNIGAAIDLELDEIDGYYSSSVNDCEENGLLNDESTFFFDDMEPVLNRRARKNRARARTLSTSEIEKIDNFYKDESYSEDNIVTLETNLQNIEPCVSKKKRRKRKKRKNSEGEKQSPGSVIYDEKWDIGKLGAVKKVEENKSSDVRKKLEMEKLGAIKKVNTNTNTLSPDGKCVNTGGQVSYEERVIKRRSRRGKRKRKGNLTEAQILFINEMSKRISKEILRSVDVNELLNNVDINEATKHFQNLLLNDNNYNQSENTLPHDQFQFQQIPEMNYNLQPQAHNFAPFHNINHQHGYNFPPPQNIPPVQIREGNYNFPQNNHFPPEIENVAEMNYNFPQHHVPKINHNFPPEIEKTYNFPQEPVPQVVYKYPPMQVANFSRLQPPEIIPNFPQLQPPEIIPNFPQLQPPEIIPNFPQLQVPGNDNFAPLQVPEITTNLPQMQVINFSPDNYPRIQAPKMIQNFPPVQVPEVILRFQVPVHEINSKQIEDPGVNYNQPNIQFPNYNLQPNPSLQIPESSTYENHPSPDLQSDTSSEELPLHEVAGYEYNLENFPQIDQLDELHLSEKNFPRLDDLNFLLDTLYQMHELKNKQNVDLEDVFSYKRDDFPPLNSLQESQQLEVSNLLGHLFPSPAKSPSATKLKALLKQLLYSYSPKTEAEIAMDVAFNRPSFTDILRVGSSARELAGKKIVEICLNRRAGGDCLCCICLKTLARDYIYGEKSLKDIWYGDLKGMRSFLYNTDAEDEFIFPCNADGKVILNDGMEGFIDEDVGDIRVEEVPFDNDYRKFRELSILETYALTNESLITFCEDVLGKEKPSLDTDTGVVTLKPSPRYSDYFYRGMSC